MLIPKFNLQSVVKPLIQIHHHSLLSSINHLLFFFLPLCADNKMNLVWKQNNYSGSVTDRSAECLSSCESMPGFLMRLSLLSPPLASPASPVSWRCWPAIAVGQSSRCLRCAPCASVWKETVTGLSPLTLTHLEKREKKKKKRERLKGFAAPLSTFLQSWNPHSKKNCPFQEFVSSGMHVCTLRGVRCERRQTKDTSKKDKYYKLQISPWFWNSKPPTWRERCRRTFWQLRHNV